MLKHKNVTDNGFTLFKSPTRTYGTEKESLDKIKTDELKLVQSESAVKPPAKSRYKKKKGLSAQEQKARANALLTPEEIEVKEAYLKEQKVKRKARNAQVQSAVAGALNKGGVASSETAAEVHFRYHLASKACGISSIPAAKAAKAMTLKLIKTELENSGLPSLDTQKMDLFVMMEAHRALERLLEATKSR